MKNTIFLAVVFGFAFNASAVEVRENQIYNAMENGCRSVVEVLALQKAIAEGSLSRSGFDRCLAALGMSAANDACTFEKDRDHQYFVECKTLNGQEYKASVSNYLFSRAVTIPATFGAGILSVFLQYKLATLLIATAGTAPTVIFGALPLASYFLYKANESRKLARITGSISESCSNCRLVENMLECDYCNDYYARAQRNQKLDISVCEAGTIRNKNGALTCELDESKCKPKSITYKDGVRTCTPL